MKILKQAPEETRMLLDRIALFDCLEDHEKDLFASSIQPREYPGGEFLFYREDPARGFYVILSGDVEILRISEEGREQILHILKEGDMAGEAPVFHGGLYPASARTKRGVRVLYIDGKAFLEAGSARPELLLGMLKIMSARIQGFVGLIHDLALKDVASRLAGRLYALYIHQGARDVILPISKSALASRIGTIPETLSRVLARMEKKSLIISRKNTIRILAPEQLLALSGGERL